MSTWCFEKRREMLGVCFRLPGVKQRIREALGLPDTKEQRKWWKNGPGKDLEREIAARDWPAILRRFPENKTLLSLGLVAGAELKVTDLLKGLMDDYKENHRHTLYGQTFKIRKMQPYFDGMSAAECTTAKVAAYRKHLIESGYANASVNRYLAALKRAFNLAVEQGSIPESAVPSFQMMSEKGNERSGFFEREEFAALLKELPDYLRGPVHVAYLTGWRKSEVLSRRKSDLNDQFLTLDAKDSKNDEGRKFPLTPELRQVLEEQAAWVRRLAVSTGRIIEWLFPNPEGDQIGDFRKAWDSAVKRAGLGQKFFHDFRRTATRNLERKRLTHLETMALVGHKTLSMHKRYNFKDDARLLEIGAQLAAADEAVQPASNISSIGGGSVAGGAKR